MIQTFLSRIATFTGAVAACMIAVSLSGCGGRETGVVEVEENAYTDAELNPAMDESYDVGDASDPTE